MSPNSRWKAAQVSPPGKAWNSVSVESHSYRKHMQVSVRSLVKRVTPITRVSAYTETLMRIPHVTGAAVIRSEKDNSLLTVIHRLWTLNATHPQLSCIMLPRETGYLKANWSPPCLTAGNMLKSRHSQD